MKPNISNPVFIILILCSILYVFAGIDYDLNIYDEGIGVYGTERVLNGDLPYRDFWTIYAPGQFYLLAGYFSIFGSSIIGSRVIAALFIILISFSLYQITRKMIPEKPYYPILSFILSSIWLSHTYQYSVINLAAILFSIVALYYLYAYWTSSLKYKAILSGAAGGLALVFRIDAGAIIFLILAVTIVIETFSEKRNFHGLIKIFALLVSGYIITTIPVFLLLMTGIPINTIYVHLISIPGEVYSGYRSLPFPYPMIDPASVKHSISLLWTGTVFYIPTIIGLAAGYYLLFRKAGTKIIDNRILLTGFLTAAVFFFSQSFVRSDIAHISTSMVMAIPLIAYFFSLQYNSKIFKFVTAGLILWILFVPVSKKLILTKQAYLSSATSELGVTGNEKLKLESNQAYEYRQLIEFIQNNVPEDEKIYIGMSDHDKIYINDIELYLLCQRECCTGYHELHPGVATEAETQRIIIGDIKKHNVEYIILFDPPFIVEQNKSSKSSNVNILDDYIRDNYNHIESFGEYHVFEKRK